MWHIWEISGYLKLFDDPWEKVQRFPFWCHCLLAEATPTCRFPQRATQCCVISINWDQRVIYIARITLFIHTHKLHKVWDADTESSKYHLLLMLLSTFGASLAKHSASSLHNNQMAECWQRNWWNFTENRFRLWTSTYSWSKSVIPDF